MVTRSVDIIFLQGINKDNIYISIKRLVHTLRQRPKEQELAAASRRVAGGWMLLLLGGAAPGHGEDGTLGAGAGLFYGKSPCATRQKGTVFQERLQQSYQSDRLSRAEIWGWTLDFLDPNSPL